MRSTSDVEIVCLDIAGRKAKERVCSKLEGIAASTCKLNGDNQGAYSGE